MPIALTWVGVLLGGCAGLAVIHICNSLVASRQVPRPQQTQSAEGVVGRITNYCRNLLITSRFINRAYCNACGHEMPIRDFLLWKRCHECGAGKSWRDFAILAIYLATGGFLWLHPSRQLGFWAGMILLVFLGIVFVMDVEHRVVLEEVSLTGAILGLILGIWIHGVWATIAGGAAGFFIMFGLYKLGDLYARWAAKRRGEEFDDVALGFGDVNLSGILGLLLGWPGIIAGLLAAILLGGAFSLLYLAGAYLLRKYRQFMAIPYAPFLVLGAVIFLFIL